MPYLAIDPEERLDYTLDWSAFLDEAGSPSDTIASSSWSVLPASVGSPTQPLLSGETNTAATATCFVANCTVGEVYRLTNRIVSAAGRTAERSLTLRCEEL